MYVSNHSLIAACFTVPGPGDDNFVSFKSSLHDFCQRYKLPPPQYITNQGPQGYSAKLKFGGLFFQSSNHFQVRIEAEQHAAFEALQGLGLLESHVKFESRRDAEAQGRPSSSLSHGSGIVTLGTVGGGSGGYGSRQGSRQGSMSNISNHSNAHSNAYNASSNAYNASSSYQQTTSIDGAMSGGMGATNPGLGSRSYSSNSGFEGHHSVQDRYNVGGSATLGHGATANMSAGGYGMANQSYGGAGGINESYSSSSSSYNAGAASANAYNAGAASANTSAVYRTQTSAQPAGGLNTSYQITSTSSPRHVALERGYESDTGGTSTFSYSLSYESHTTTEGPQGTTVKSNTLGPVVRQVRLIFVVRNFLQKFGF